MTHRTEIKRRVLREIESMPDTETKVEWKCPDAFGRLHTEAEELKEVEA